MTANCGKSLTEHVWVTFLILFFIRSAYSLVSFPNSHLIPLEYVVVETILSNLFALPTSKHLDIFYGSLLLELCRINPGTFPQVVRIGFIL